MFSSLLSTSLPLYAHKKDTQYESLEEHSNHTLSIYHKLKDTYSIDSFFERFGQHFTFTDPKGNIHKLSAESITLLSDWFEKAIYLHDIGKINPAFQLEKMDNHFFSSIPKVKSMESDHAFLSSYIFLDTLLPECKTIKNPFEQLCMRYFLFQFAFVIFKHHGSLSNSHELYEQKQFFNKLYQKAHDFSYLANYQNKGNLTKDSINFFSHMKHIQFNEKGYFVHFLIRLLFSSLLTCDHLATSNWMENKTADDTIFETIKNCSKTREHFESNPIIQSIRKGSATAPINVLRSEMFREVEKNLLSDTSPSLYMIEKPTGSGKTVSSLNITLHLAEQANLQKIIYAFPFNTLVDQTAKTMKEAYGLSELPIINSISAMKERTDEDGSIDYQSTLLDRMTWNYDTMLTSHVAFFQALFGHHKSNAFPLCSLFQTVIVLDEIQSYRTGIWREIIEGLHVYSLLFNSKIVLMSATLPHLSLLSEHEIEVKPLLSNPSYYMNHPLFKKRVNVDNSLLSVPFNNEYLANHIIQSITQRNALSINKDPHTKVLVEFITKKEATNFACYLKTVSELPIYELTGDTNRLEREYILDTIKQSNKNMIVICTQVIEAGIDIDMDIGYKDTSLLDSEEQFIGRINRSCLKDNCKAYFFHLDQQEKIYSGDIRSLFTINQSNFFSLFKEKDFNSYYNEVFSLQRKQHQSLSLGIHHFYTYFHSGKHEDISKHMNMINSQTITIFLPYTYNRNGILIDGQAVWGNYCSLIADTTIPYAEKKVKLKQYAQYLDIFSFTIYGSEIIGLEPVHGCYVIPDAERFIDNNTFQSELFKTSYSIK